MRDFKDIKIAVAGTGYVGLSIATLLSQHHHVTTVDVIPEKVEKLNNKISPIQDDYIEKYLAEKDLNLTATLDGAAAYKDADYVVIAAPTNYDPQKNFFDTHHIEDVIDLVLSVNPGAVMVIKSTIPVGYCRGLYLKYAEQLIEQGDAYYCFCDKERLESLKSKVSDEDGGTEIVVYDKHCLHLSKEEIEANLAAGKPHVIRFNMPTEGTTTFHDEIYGDITVPNEELDDLILIKSDGYPTYNFANVVDDHLMGITHVVRGNEYLSSAPKYNKIYEAFGWDVPIYVHCPLITDENHKKLSKRCGHSSYEDLIEQGFVTEAVVNYVALLGWSPEGNQEIFSLEELVKAFDFHRMNKSPAVFDLGKLKWMNGEYIKAMDFDKFYERAEGYIRKVITKDYDLKKIAALVKSRIEIFPDIAEQIDFFEAVPEYDTAMYCHKKMKTNEENSLEVLREVLPLLEAQEDYSNDALFALLKSYVDEKGVKVGYVMWPIRTAVSGKQSTPGGATEIMEILGKEESVKRIKDGIELLSK